MNAAAVDRRKKQTSDEIRDGFPAGQEREGFSEFVFADQFADDRLGTGDNESAWTSDDDGQEDEPGVPTVRHHRQSYDLKCQSDHGKTEIAKVEEVNETRKQDGRSEAKTSVVGRQQISIH